MNKWFGKIGYADQVEDVPGVWKNQVVEREYYGDVLANVRNLQSSDKLIDDININNKISILADPYADHHFHLIKYAEFMGANWTVTNVEVNSPRLILTLGGLYNGEQA